MKKTVADEQQQHQYYPHGDGATVVLLVTISISQKQRMACIANGYCIPAKTSRRKLHVRQYGVTIIPVDSRLRARQQVVPAANTLGKILYEPHSSTDRSPGRTLFRTQLFTLPNLCLRSIFVCFQRRLCGDEPSLPRGQPFRRLPTFPAPSARNRTLRSNSRTFAT